MNRIPIALTLAICSASTGCGAPTEGENGVETVASIEQALDVTKTGSLTRKQGGLSSVTNEDLRQQDTVGYYGDVGINQFGTGVSIKNGIPDLNTFISLYGFAGSETVGYYYNRGDLGIGREMHCVDKITSTGEIACYVRNFAAGTDDSELTFGMSTNVAFNNMDANHPFATVAMVYRDQMAANAVNKVYFVVFNAAGTRVNAAALDRTGVLFATGRNVSSIPGTNFNNHIPSNCASCHGGLYDSSAHMLTGGLFLPFDLDQFEYQAAAGKSRSAQAGPGSNNAFKRLNEMVRKVAVRSGSNTNQAVRRQLDGWYGNTALQSDSKLEVFENEFNSAFVPAYTGSSGTDAAWTSASSAYSNVVRPVCRSCHITNSIPMDTETQFRNLMSLLGGPGTGVGDICAYQMPHALQAVREFWLTSRPAQLEGYLRNAGLNSVADQLHGCSPGHVATLDPQFIATLSSSPLLSL